MYLQPFFDFQQWHFFRLFWSEQKFNTIIVLEKKEKKIYRKTSVLMLASVAQPWGNEMAGLEVQVLCWSSLYQPGRCRVWSQFTFWTFCLEAQPPSVWVSCPFASTPVPKKFGSQTETDYHYLKAYFLHVRTSPTYPIFKQMLQEKTMLFWDHLVELGGEGILPNSCLMQVYRILDLLSLIFLVSLCPKCFHLVKDLDCRLYSSALKPLLLWSYAAVLLKRVRSSQKKTPCGLEHMFL